MLTLLLWLGCATAEPPRFIPLAPVLESLQVADRGVPTIPIRSAADIGDLGKVVWRPLGVYPISEFATSPDGRWAAMRFHRGLAPEGSRLEDKTVLVRIDEGGPRIHKVIAPPNGRTQSLAFLGDDRLRIETTAEVEGPQGYRRDYAFYDIRADRVTTFERATGLAGVFDVRAYGAGDYIVAVTERKAKTFYVVHYDGARATKRWQTGDEALGRQLLRAPVDEPGRDVFELEGETLVFLGRDDGRGWVDWRLRLAERTDFRRAPRFDDEFPVLRARASSSRSDGSQVAVVNGRGETLTYPVPHVHSPLTRVTGGFVAFQSDHPHYGAFLLGDDGRVQSLTGGLRLIHSHVHAGAISGLNHQKRDFSDLSLVYARFAPGAPAPFRTTVNVAGFPQKYPVVGRDRSGRRRIVQMEERRLGVVDMFQDEQITDTINLRDEHYTLEWTPGALLVKYPGLGELDVLTVNGFTRVTTHKCADDL